MSTTTNSGPAAPAWRSLAEPGGPHWKSLIRGYVPEGLLDLIKEPPGLVIDVGCFCGAVGERLKAKYPGVRVVGVEPLAQAANEARRVLDCVLEGKLEEVDLAGAGVTEHSTDVIVLADVLEHMYDPWNALQNLRALLKPGGIVLASIPNIRNWVVIEQLIQGDFEYAETGTLDITHLRFFTLSGVKRLFGEAGYRLDQVLHRFDPRCEKLLEGLKSQPPIHIDSEFLQVKGQTHEKLAELATLQFWVRAVPA